MASRDSFEPGLFNIDGKTEGILDKQYLTPLIKELTFDYEAEPSYLKPVIENIQAVLKFHKKSGRTKAQEMLEDLVEKNARDLNALADLIHIYKDTDQMEKLKKYRKQLRLYKNDKGSKARSILGQAYAMGIYILGRNDKTPTTLLEETWKKINIMKDKYLEQAERVKNSIEEAYKVARTIPEKPYQNEIDFFEIAVQKFEYGINLLEELKCSKEEISVWKFNSVYRRLGLFHCKAEGGVWSRAILIKALEDYLEIIQNLSSIEDLKPPLKVYLARSYIGFADKCDKWRDFINHDDVPESIKSQDLDSMRNEALTRCPNDPEILVNYGNYLLRKMKHLEAIKLYDRAIDQSQSFPEILIFERCNAYHLYSRELIKKGTDQDKIDKYLKLAYDDMKTVFESEYLQLHLRADVIIPFVRICLDRAMSDYTPGARFHCKNKKFVLEALDNLKEMLKKGFMKEYRIHSLLGTCYFYINNHRKVIDSLKTALELIEWSEECHDVYSMFCHSFVALYERENHKKVLSEFCLWLKEAEKRHCYEWVIVAMIIMKERNPRMLTDLVKNMIESDVIGNDKLICTAIYASYEEDQPESIKICQYLWKGFGSKFQQKNNQESEIDEPTGIQKSQRKEEFQYDFFVSFSPTDENWVDEMLLERLENSGGEIKFRGFSPEREMIHLESKIFNSLDGIKQSRKLLIILSPDYLKDKWLEYITDHMVLSVLETKRDEKTIIPIILTKCKIPDKLKTFKPISFTDGCRWEELLVRLTENMGLKTGLEDQMSSLTPTDKD